jgi:hypothetical protein
MMDRKSGVYMFDVQRHQRFSRWTLEAHRRNIIRFIAQHPRYHFQSMMPMLCA